MLAIQAHCHAGHIQISTEGIPLDAKVVVVFLSETVASDPALALDFMVFVLAVFGLTGWRPGRSRSLPE